MMPSAKNGISSRADLARPHGNRSYRAGKHVAVVGSPPRAPSSGPRRMSIDNNNDSKLSRHAVDDPTRAGARNEPHDHCATRTVADIAAVADPNTGVAVFGRHRCASGMTRPSWSVSGARYSSHQASIISTQLIFTPSDPRMDSDGMRRGAPGGCAACSRCPLQRSC